MAVAKTPQLNTKASTTGTLGGSPTVTLATVSTTQVPTHIDHVRPVTVGEDPLYHVHMRDGTWVYLKESQLSQMTGQIVF